ncbi:MAG: hypothetical protein MUF35_01085 [Candidatus Nanopelagicales bacterium]|jgi:hypothetical protein|nr:hypothetical protein [Candidatus Nanopelagicales bacterium]
MSLLDLTGWISSALVVWSLMLSSVWRFRWMNLAGAALATVVNALLGIWPFAVMNGVIAVIDVYWIWRLGRERHDEAAYQVVEVDPEDAYLQHLLATKRADVAATHPGFRGIRPGSSAHLVLRGDETVGMVVVSDAGEGVGSVDLDYVSARFRDFTPGEFVYRRSGIFADRGFTRLRAVDSPAARDYYQRVGFRQVGDHWERPVEPVPA